MNKLIRCLLRTFLLLAMLSMACHLWAATCTQTFPSGLASASNTSSITINYGANIYNVPNNQLVTKNLNSSSNACNASACSKTDTVAQQAANFNNFPGGASVYVNYQETRNFAASTNFSSFGSNTLTVLNFAPGDYTINGSVQLGSETRLNVTADGTVRIFVSGNLDIGADAQINMSGGSNRYVYIYTRGYFTMHTGADAKAVVYAKGDVTLNNNITFTGAITSEANMNLQFGAALTYNASYVNGTNFGSSCTAGASLNSFLIDVGGGTANTCSPKRITITARDASNNKLTGYTGTISLKTSTNRGTWAKITPTDANGTWTAGSDNGQATYTFTAADAGDIALNLENQRAQSLTITVADASAGKSNTSGTLIFSDNTFVIADDDILKKDVVAGRDHKFTVTMMRRDPSTGFCGAAKGYNISAQKMWLTRNASDPGGGAPKVNSVALLDSQPLNNNINLSFTDGVAPLVLSTTDVGKYVIKIADTSNSFASGTISGESDTLVVRPFGISINITENPAATNAGGSIFRKAGENFTVLVTAVRWQSADDQNNDGIPDSHDDLTPGNNANLKDNDPLVKFGKESPAEGITLNAEHFLPAGINAGLSGAFNFSSFSAGSSSASISYGEVGIIEIAAKITDGDYMGSPGSAKIIGKSGYVGRFIPDHFSLSGLSLTPACNSGLAYSYTGENFSLAATMTPYGANGVALKNYIQGFDKFNKSAAPSMFYAVDAASASNLTSRLLSPSPTTVYAWSNGVLNATPSFNISRLANPDGPFTQVKMGFKPVDTDGVTLRTGELNLDVNNDGVMDAAIVGNPFRLFYGRLRLDDSYGPETANLPVIFRTEYWNGSEWRQNRDDSCTKIASNKIRYPGGLINVVANRSTAVGAGSTTGVYANLDATSVNFSAGDAGHYFTAPGAGNTGSVTVQVDLANYPWLQFDWNGDGIYSDASLPNARFTFGNYRGHDRVLYWIESSKH